MIKTHHTIPHNTTTLTSNKYTIESLQKICEINEIKLLTNYEQKILN